MNIFYDNKSNYESFHLRDIARKSKLNENSASRFLKELERSKLLYSKKDGNLKKYLFVQNKKVYSVFTLFDIEKFERLPSLRKKAINLFLQTLEKKPIFALLFGSTAKENFNSKSDIDILLISNEKISILKAESEADAETGLRVQCVQITYKRFLSELKLKEDAVIQSAVYSGYPILNHIYYYGVVFNGNK